MTARPLVAVVHAAHDGPLARAVADQEGVPDLTNRAQAEWLWLLDGTAIPRPGALAALLGALERLTPIVVPAVLASRVVTPEGALAPTHVPLAPQGEQALSIRTVAERVLHVRAVAGGSLLVRAALAPDRTPARPAATMAWSAAVLRDVPGFLVPDSVADAWAGRYRRRRERLLVAGALIGRPGGLRTRERLRVAARTLERAP